MEEFRKQLVQVFNDSQLPFEAKFYILKDVFRDVDDVYKNVLEQMQEKAEGSKEQT